MLQVFNINKHVLVKLTEEGKKRWKKHFERYKDPVSKKLRKEYPFAEHYERHTSNRLHPGYSTFQLHELMEIFGENIQTSSYFETNILIDTKDLSRPKKS